MSPFIHCFSFFLRNDDVASFPKLFNAFFSNFAGNRRLLDCARCAQLLLMARLYQASDYLLTREKVASAGSRPGASPTAVAQRFGVSYQFVQYWTHKKLDPSWHEGSYVFYKQELNSVDCIFAVCAGSWGGARHFAFSQGEMAIITLILFLCVKLTPLAHLKGYVDCLSSFGFQTNKSYVRRCLKSLGISYKQVRMRAVCFSCCHASIADFTGVVVG